ncbi:MAG: hypothetical protein BECKG1743E_GA0114224_104371, partial [Candidatus Kentron sp. G]
PPLKTLGYSPIRIIDLSLLLLHNILRLIIFILLPIWEIIIRLPWQYVGGGVGTVIEFEGLGKTKIP